MTVDYRDADASAEERARDLLGRMTLEEKVGQMNQHLAGWEAYTGSRGSLQISDAFKEAVEEVGMGFVYGLFRADPWTGVTLENGARPAEGARLANELQRYVIEHTRLGIPLLFSEECPHGHMAIDGTVFPSPITLAGTWEPELAREMGRIAASEIRARGAHIGYGPILDIAQDPRWSRVEETYGEDPYLAGLFGEAMVEGMQRGGLEADDAAVSTLKHFAGYGAPEGGHNTAATHAGERELREVFLPAFKRAIKAGAGSVMAAYNEIDGLPCHANPYLLRDILKGKWGFEGFVVSDGGGIDRLVEQKVAETPEDAGAVAAQAGVDASVWDEAYTKLATAVESGKVSVEAVNEAVFRILRTKFAFGLFEDPYVDEERAAEVIGTSESREVSLDISRKAVTLLKNDDELLPFGSDIGSIAVIGPNADRVYNQLGDYTAPQPRESVTTVRDGIESRAPDGVTVRYAHGCGVKNPSREEVPEAVRIAEQSDVAVLVLGGSSARDFDAEKSESGAAVVGGNMEDDMDCGEGFDRADLRLAGAQLELVREVCATGTPVVAVLVQGRPYSIPGVVEQADALVTVWYPGPEGGQAVAEALFGDFSPAGRLPVSVPRCVGQVPVYYNYKPVSRRQYVLTDSAPLFPFGYGLSYTSFSYGDPTTDRDSVGVGEAVEVSVEVANTGERAGDEVVQLYVHDEIASVTRPVKELKGFRRIHLGAGETRTVNFSLHTDDLAFVGPDMEWVTEPGEFRVMVGPNSDELQETTITVVER
jgi:beta-glucosidase